MQIWAKLDDLTDGGWGEVCQQAAADEYLLFYCCLFGLYKTSFGVHILLQPLQAF